MVLGVALAVAGVVALVATRREPARPGSPAFVGSAECARCHEPEAAAWRGSQHERAMQPATDETVLGAFDGGTITVHGVTSTFFRADGGFFVRTDGPDGGLADFAVSWTFGVEPLQQVLVDFPDGRKQALGLAWDSRAADAGGQRWFHLYPDEPLRAGDPLHWTSLEQNWNFQCADCHSTNVRKGFDPVRDTFATTWSEVSVGCEACHGPGSRHVEWAKRADHSDSSRGLTAVLDERRGVSWTLDGGVPVRSRPRSTSRELDVCARCHARRGQLTDQHVAGAPFTDAFRPALLVPGLYWPDGQMRDEVYNWGSFVQSRMHARGVTCSDCHDPHSGKLRAADNGVCAQCHAPSRYDQPEHHHHAAGATCVGCHLPPTTYMLIDRRHDHSMRIPRPDQSLALGTPNACAGCHADRPARWAADAVAAWFPRPTQGFQDFAEAFAGAERGEPTALARLAEIATRSTEPALVRASAVARLAHSGHRAAQPTLRAALADPDPLVRMAAVTGLGEADVTTRSTLLTPLLDDPSRLVRTEVARALAGASIDSELLQRATDEFLAEQRFLADRPEAHLALGNFALARRDTATALREFSRALALSPSSPEAAVNLADLHRALGEEARAEQVLRASLLGAPESAAVHHALGLSLVRQGRQADAIDELARAASLAPGEGRFAFVYAVAVHDAVSPAEGLRIADRVLAIHPHNRDLLTAAANWHAEAGEAAQALSLARRVLELDPEDPVATSLVRALGP